MTVIEPTTEQMPTYTNTLVVPWAGAATKTRYMVRLNAATQYSTKPAAEECQQPRSGDVYYPAAVELTRLRCQHTHLEHGAQGLLSRRVQHDGERPRDAQEAAQQAKQVEALVEHQVRQDCTAATTHSSDRLSSSATQPASQQGSPDDDAERSKRCDQDGRRKGVGCEVGDLADHHREQAAPP